MEPIFYIMAIMGCGDAQMSCQQARLEPARYASAEACQKAMPDVLVRNSDLPYPVITAACQKSEVRTAQVQLPRRGAR